MSIYQITLSLILTFSGIVDLYSKEENNKDYKALIANAKKGDWESLNELAFHSNTDIDPENIKEIFKIALNLKRTNMTLFLSYK